jgi:hypothetical protein
MTEDQVKNESPKVE